MLTMSVHSLTQTFYLTGEMMINNWFAKFLFWLISVDQLMKSVIYRCTYRQLYLFQKTLEETGQSVMAATVPVILQKKKAPSHESSYAATAIPLVQTEMVEGGITSDQRQLTYQRDS